MTTIGSDSHGDAYTIPEDLQEDYFPPDFKEYMRKEQLKWSRYKNNFWRYFGWVFWSQQDHEIEPSHSLDNCAYFNPNVRDNIRFALQKLRPSETLCLSLVQFWAATTTLEGRTKLTTQYQPFALGGTDTTERQTDTTERQQLCEYRMKMCRDYNFFYADAESGEEQQLGLLGRVFLHKSPESSPDVKYYSTKEYPQRDLALHCKIKGSWAVPVFEHSSQTCVGVLEMVSLYSMSSDWCDESIRRNMRDSFQEFGLQCFVGCQAGESRKTGKRVKGLTCALKELKTVLRSVCQIRELPLAMTWVPCSACNGLRRCKLRSTGVEFRLPRHLYHSEFLEASKYHHLRKGLVAGRALSSLNMLYCSDITQLSLDEYPLVPYARLCKLSGWFTICLQNIYTGNDIYVLEFFLSARSKDDGNILTTLGFILGTMEKCFKTFRLASGKELGELMSIEVIDFQNGQKIHSVRRIQATRDFSSLSHLSSVQSSASVAYKRPRFQDPNMVTIKGRYDLNSDPFFDSDPCSDSDPSFEESSTSVANARPGFQDADMVTIKAKSASIEGVLKLSLPCRLVELRRDMDTRLMLEAGTYHVGYKDDEDSFILIACDEDLQHYVRDSISQGNTPPVVLLEPKEPATILNPTYAREISGAFKSTTNNGMRNPLLIRWVPPLAGMIKLNTDGRQYLTNAKAGFGGLFRDPQGKWLLGFYGRIEAETSLETELWAIYRGLTIILEKSMPRFTIESDSGVAVSLINEGCPRNHPQSNIIKDVKDLLYLTEATLIYIFREANECADHLAKMGAEQEEPLAVMEDMPISIREFMLRDSLGIRQILH